MADVGVNQGIFLPDSLRTVTGDWVVDTFGQVKLEAEVSKCLASICKFTFISRKKFDGITSYVVYQLWRDLFASLF